MSETTRVVPLEEVLQETVAILNTILITPESVRTVGLPVASAIDNLKLCIKAIERDKAQNEDSPVESAED